MNVRGAKTVCSGQHQSVPFDQLRPPKRSQARRVATGYASTSGRQRQRQRQRRSCRGRKAEEPLGLSGIEDLEQEAPEHGDQK